MHSKLKIKGVSFGLARILPVGILFSALGVKSAPLFFHSFHHPVL